jgi:hypothetical protein
MKKVAIIQSNYIPWKGYFDIINYVDVFVFLDNVQYTTRDWRNRNKIKTVNGTKWLTVPNNGTQNMLIKDVQVDNTQNWQKKHYSTLLTSYKKCPFFQDYAYLIEDIYIEKTWTSLSELNQYFTQQISKCLNIDTILLSSNDFSFDGGKNERLIHIINKVGGDYYVTGSAAKSYIENELFEKEGIRLEYFEYPTYPTYNQPFGDFDHYVSILDLLFCTGKDAPGFIFSK